MPVASMASSWFPSGSTSLVEALEKLMWLVQVEYRHYGGGLEVRGYIIPRPEAETEGQLVAGFMESMEEILDILDQAGMELRGYPEIQLGNNSRNGLEMQVMFEITDIA